MTTEYSFSQLVFQKQESKKHLKEIARILFNEYSLPKQKVLQLLKYNTPALIMPFAPYEEVQEQHERLLKLGCLTQNVSLETDPEFPFPIPSAHSKHISRELSKVDRSKTTMLLVLAEIRPLPEAPPHISVLGQVLENLQTHLRLSDTVLGVDDMRILALGFTTKGEHAPVLENKIRQRLMRIYGNTVEVSIGSALFPQEGRHIHELLHLAEDKRTQGEKNEQERRKEKTTQQNLGVTPAMEDDGYVPLVFRRASGRQFHKLLTLDAGTLYAGIYSLNPTERSDFLSRMDHHSTVTEDLEDRLERNARPTVDPRSPLAELIEPALFQKELKMRESNKEKVLQKLNDTQSLPTLPAVAMQVFELASDPEADTQDVVDVINRDPAMSSKLLQIANSPFYGFSTQVMDIDRAVVLLGFSVVMDLALGLAAANVLKDSAISKIYNPEVIWRHSYITGVLAGKLAHSATPQKKSQVFTIALLHDIGKIFFATHFTEAYKNVAANSARFNIPMHELETELFGVNHAEVGKTIALNWNFPEKIVDGIAYHHAPHKETHSTGIPALIGFADYLYNLASSEMEHDEAYPAPEPILTHGHWRMLTYYSRGVNEKSMEKIQTYAAKLIEENKDIAAMF